MLLRCLSFFFFNDTATTEIYTLSLHDALPISQATASARRPCARTSAATGSSTARRRLHATTWRSEEHTSELQSLAYLVCRLLLEKKKTKKIHLHPKNTVTTRRERQTKLHITAL